MKISKFQKALALVLGGALLVLSLNASAQSAPAAVPQMPYAASEVVKLVQAKINDNTIIAFINSTRGGYSLNADQIVYLRQLGASEAVIQAMLSQPRPAGASAPMAPTAPPSVQPTATVSTASTAVVVPSATYVQPVPAPYYYDPYYYPYYSPYYGYYGWPFPGVALSFGWGRGGGWHGGFRR